MPSVTIIMPVYNANPYLKEAVDSILSQKFIDFELIAIDDFSSDGSIDILESYRDPRVIILQNDKNLGIVQTLNRGLDIARGKYIARMDSDDISMPDRIGKQFSFLESNPEIGVVGTRGKYIDEEGKVLCLVPHPLSDRNIKTLLLAKNCIFHPSIMIRSELILSRKYSEGYKHAEDYWLWGDLITSTKFKNLPEYLIKYRIRGNNLSILANRSVSERFEVLGKIYKRIFEDIGLILSDEEIEKYTSFVTMIKHQPQSHVEMIHLFNKVLKEIPINYNRKLLKKHYSLVWAWHTRFKVWNLNTFSFNIEGIKRYSINKLIETWLSISSTTK